jgi:hypothetical protein
MNQGGRARRSAVRDQLWRLGVSQPIPENLKL